MIIVDAGSRYGIHPTFEYFSEFASFHLFEPDQEEASRLAKKYALNNNIQIHKLGLGLSEQLMSLNIKGHPALSTTCDLNSNLFATSDRKAQQESLSSQSISIKRLDQILTAQPDFYKLDIEGMELEALKGAGNLIHGLAGVRCEVQLQSVHLGCSTFSEIDQWLSDQDFALISLDNLIAGRLTNRFSSSASDGKLLSCDAVWIHKRYLSEHLSLREKILFPLWLFANNLHSEALDFLFSVTSSSPKFVAQIQDLSTDQDIPTMLLILKKFILQHVLRLRSLSESALSDMNHIYKSLYQQALPEPHLIRYEIDSVYSN